MKTFCCVRTIVAMTLRGCLAAALASAPSLVSAAEPVHQFNIKAQPLAAALLDFSRQADEQIVGASEVIGAQQTKGIAGKLATREALERLLAGSGLRFEFVNERTIRIYGVSATPVALKPIAYGDVVAAKPSDSVQSAAKDDRDSAHSATAQAPIESPAESDGLDEIIVTAGKVASKLMDTPVSMTVLESKELTQRSLVSATDYLNYVPGVHIESYGLTDNQLVIRGLGVSLAQSPTAGAYLGDVPLTNPVDFQMTDVKLVDMARVEVLRGPQGTLYGSEAMGGVVRQIPKAPVLNSFEGSVQTGYAHTAESGDASYNVVGIVNIPLVQDLLALRAAVYDYHKAGYVDLVSNPAIQALSTLMQLPVVLKNDYGANDYKGARVSVLFKPADRLDTTLMVGYQKLHQDGANEVAESTGSYFNSILATGAEFREQEFTYINLDANYDLDWARLSLASSFTKKDYTDNFSHTRVIPSGSTVPDNNGEHAVFEELRIATDPLKRLQFVGGVYYEDIAENTANAVQWVSPNLEQLVAFWGTNDPDIYRSFGYTNLRQLATFGELGIRLIDGLTLKLGDRWFDYERHDSSITYLGIAPGVPPEVQTSGDLPAKQKGESHKVGLDYKPSENALIYAVWSQGFRLGQTIDNTGIDALFGEVCDPTHSGVIVGTEFPYSSQFSLTSDKIDNYELGGKFSLLDHRLNISTALYRINWHNVPVTVNVAVNGLGCSSTFNGGEARSDGIEFDGSVRLTRNLQVNLSGSVTNTKYLDDLTGQQGNPLPFVPKYNGNLGLQYSAEFFGRPVFVRSDYSYVSRSATSFFAPDLAFADSYTNLGARAGVAFGRVNLELYGTNLTEQRPLVGVFNLNRGWRLEPRVLGVDVRYEF